MNYLSKYRASFLAAFLAVASLQPAAHAQNERTVGKVNVPFAFDFGSQHYAAGIYEIQTLGRDVLMIRGASHFGLAMMRVDEDNPPAETAKAVFGIYGNKYYLREVWGRGPGERLMLNQPKAKHREQVASESTAPAGVTELALLDAPR